MARDAYAGRQHTVGDIAASFDVSRATIYNYLRPREGRGNVG